MKLTTLMLIVGLIQVSAKGFSQITLKENNTPLPKIIQSIKKQSGYYFFYDEDQLNKERISINIKDATLKDALYRCLKNTPFTFTIVEKNVVISVRENAAVAISAAEDTITLRLTIVDPSGKPLPGAVIASPLTAVSSAEETIQIGVTDEQGHFVFKKIKKEALIKISYVGYKTKFIRANSHLDKITLEPGSIDLDETNVVAYGTESRRFSTGSVSIITSKDIENQPITNPLLALEGRVPGLAVNALSGVPGSSVQVQVRGQNSLQNNTSPIKPYDQPLFLVDGVPMAAQNVNVNQFSSFISSNYGPGGYSGVSPFNSINPQDIESITVLKDADATSIYGSQGANGVILITTKKGKPGKARFDASVTTGYNSAARPVQLLNTQQYLQLRNDAFKADGVVPQGTDPFNQGYAPDLFIFDQHKYTDWENKILGKTSNSTDIHTSISGGANGSTFLFSTGYSKSDYNFPGDYKDNRLTLHSNFHHQSSDGRLKLDFGTDFAYDKNNSPAAEATEAILIPPNVPDLIDPNGNLVWNYKGVDLSAYQFYGPLKTTSNIQNYNLNTTFYVGYKLAKGLTFGTHIGLNRMTVDEAQQYPFASQSPQNASSYSYFAKSAYQTLNIEPQIDYEQAFGKGTLSALLGGTYRKNTSDLSQQQGYGYSSDAFLGSINGASSVTSGDNSDINKYVGVFGRLKYIYNQKYILTVTGRRDGSSNFGPGRQFGNFGSAGAGWIFSEEGFFKNAFPPISYGKIAVNYGTTGSDGVNSYLFQNFWQANSSAPPFLGTRPYAPTNLYNPDFSWATKKSLNIAIDLGFFHDRLLLNATYYRSREGNQLTNYPLASQAGFPSVLENLDATVQNKGWEFSASSTNIKTTGFTWTSNFNVSANRNKLIAFPGLASSSYASIYSIGLPTSTVFGFKFKGVNPNTGIFEYFTANGQTTSQPNPAAATQGGDLLPVANIEPKFFGGLGNNFTYKGFTLSIYLQFAKQTAANYLSTLYSGNNQPGLITNVPLQVLGAYWKAPGDHTQLESLTTQYGAASAAASYFSTSSGAYSDDTYLRVKTVSLAYVLPGSLLRRSGISNLRVYANGQNLFTFTNYQVGDPEQPGQYNGFPLQRTIVFGLSFNIN